MSTYDASLIADFMLSKADPEAGDAISNLKLQKLLYYAAGVIAALRANEGAPLFADPIEAWQHGPVVPTQYHRFCQYGRDPIPLPQGVDFDQIEGRDLEVLDDVYDFYGQYSAWKLRNMTHEEGPWIAAYDRPNKAISQRELIGFFSGEIDEAYIEEYNKAA